MRSVTWISASQQRKTAGKTDSDYGHRTTAQPLLVLIFSVYYMLPLTGWNVTSFWAAISALAAFQTAHVIEVTRGAAF